MTATHAGKSAVRSDATTGYAGRSAVRSDDALHELGGEPAYSPPLAVYNGV